ncbi:MAG TPA: hypothetical protein VHE35_04240 [Kofleriaceae bacterium]|nr:hypothetical protein [Kofleriaceae bacterium]
MTSTGWRNACVAFAALSAFLAWRSCTRVPAPPTEAACARAADQRAADGDRDGDGALPSRGHDRAAPRPRATGGPDPADRDDGAGDNAFNVSVPAWALWLAPQPGEDLLHYRDRMLPLAEAAIAPQRARVARGRDAFFAAAGVDDHQRAELDAAVAEAADTIETRVLDGVLGGELMPANFKPMAGVDAARDVLDAVTRANQRFLASLRDDQRALLARSRFDVADYLLFSTRWEDALGGP